MFFLTVDIPYGSPRVKARLFYIFFLMASVAIVANLEHTIRHSKGAQRTRIKSFSLGFGGLFAFSIYVSTQTLLFSQINLGMIPVSSSVLIICTGLIAFSAVRHRLMDVRLYLPRAVIYNSLTLLIVGDYLIFVVLVSQMVRSFTQLLYT